MRHGSIAVSLVAFAGLVFATLPTGHAMTLSTMMCVGNGCPERTYAYHRCDRGYIWSARTHRCVRRVGADGARNHRVSPGKQQGKP